MEARRVASAGTSTPPSMPLHGAAVCAMGRERAVSKRAERRTARLRAGADWGDPRDRSEAKRRASLALTRATEPHSPVRSQRRRTTTTMVGAVLRDLEPKGGSENVLHCVDQWFRIVGQSR